MNILPVVRNWKGDKWSLFYDTLDPWYQYKGVDFCTKDISYLLESMAGTTFQEELKGIGLEVSPVLEGAIEEAQRLYDLELSVTHGSVRKLEEKDLYAFLDPFNPEKILVISKEKFVRHILLDIIRKGICEREDELAKWLTKMFVNLPTLGLSWMFSNITRDDLDEHKMTHWASPLKVGKLVRKLLVNQDDSNKVQVFADHLQGVLRQRAANVNEVQVSDTPSEVYIMEGLEGHSCMACEIEEEKFLIYDDLPCKIAYIKDEKDNLVARALLWDEVIDHNGMDFPLMDRVYFTEDRYRDTMLAWARKNGYWVKKTQSLGEYRFVTPNGNEWVKADIHVKCPTWRAYSYMEVPYIDTFPYAREGEATLRSKPSDAREKMLAHMQNQDGVGAFLTGTYYCKECDKKFYEEEGHIHTSGFYCQTCWNKMVHKCVACGERKHENDLNEVRINGQHYDSWLCTDCLKKEFTRSRSDLDMVWHNSKLLEALNECGHYVQITPTDLYEQGKWEMCSRCGDIHIAARLYEVNGMDYCSSCAAEVEDETENSTEVEE